eukprot:Skav221098  [mRNA]  locus=scaffold4552:235210:239765:+ [translate_table: standard]
MRPTMKKLVMQISEATRVISMLKNSEKISRRANSNPKAPSIDVTMITILNLCARYPKVTAAKTSTIQK